MKKVFLGIGIILIVFILAVVWTTKANSTKNKDNLVEFKNDNSSKNAIIIYQKGRSSYSKEVAESIAKYLSENGYNVALNQPGDFLGQDLSKYNLVIFGSPVYMGQTSSQIKNYASSVKNYGNARVICYCVGNSESEDESKDLKNALGIKVDGSFKVARSQFKSNNNIAIEQIKKLIE